MSGIDYVHVAPDALAGHARALLDAGGRMQMAYAWRTPDGVTQVRYLAARAAHAPWQVWVCTPPPRGRLPSLAAHMPLLGWYEREMMDFYGLLFDGHPEPRPLIRDDRPAGSEPPPPPWYLPELQGEGLQQLAFGPVRADVLESMQSLFVYAGEAIVHYQPRLFFKHRGMEQAFVGRAPDAGVVLAERVSGVGSVAHALAYCMAVEHACGCAPPPRAQQLRVVLAELERLYNHLHYFGHLADTTTLKVGRAEGLLLEERFKQLNARLTGSRFLRSLLIPGGLRRDLTGCGDMAAQLAELRRHSRAYLRQLERTNSYQDRLIGTGALSRPVAFDQGATGPVERASGLDRDLRRDHPYAAYARHCPAVPVQHDGDAQARARVRAEEVEASFDLLEALLPRIETGPVRAPCMPDGAGEGLGWAESPRGSLYYAVHIGTDGRLSRVKIKSPSFSNWRVFPYTVHGSNLMDYAINEASFGLTIAGCDR